MANEYAQLATLKSMLNIETADTTSDALLSMALTTASRAIDRMTSRRFWLDAAPTQRIYNPNQRAAWDATGQLLMVDDIGDTSGLVVEVGSGSSWTAITKYETVPENALADGRPITALLRVYGFWGYLQGRVRVTARFGWPTVPDEVVQATLIQASRLYKRKDSPEGVIGSAEWGVVRLARVDPDVQALVGNFALPGFG